MKKFSFLVFTCLVTLLYSCEKNAADNCAKIQGLRIKADQDTFYVGDRIHLTVTQRPSTAMYNWMLGNDPTNLTYNPDLYIEYCDKGDEGWYHLNVSNPDCASRNDSVYITVLNNPATAPCTSNNNTITFSSLPSLNPATVSWGYNTTWARRLLYARGASGYPDFNIYFNTYWDKKEPEDGEYTVTTMSATNDFPPYTVYISSLYSSTFFQAGSGKVYVSHVNGKLRVSFCGISLTGSTGGPGFSTTATGTLTAP